MCSSGRSIGPTSVVVDKFCKSSLFYGSGQFLDGNKEMKGNGVAIEDVREGLANNDVIAEGFGKEW